MSNADGEVLEAAEGEVLETVDGDAWLLVSGLMGVGLMLGWTWHPASSMRAKTGVASMRTADRRPVVAEQFVAAARPGPAGSVFSAIISPRGFSPNPSRRRRAGDVLWNGFKETIPGIEDTES